MNCDLKNFTISAKKSEVILRLEGQPQVTWLRTPSGTQYHIDTETNEKCGKNDLWDFLPQYPIQQEPDGKIFNFHTEFDILFPFGFSSQELFKIFERVVSLEDTASVLRSMNEELTFLTSQRDREYRVNQKEEAVVEEEKEAVRRVREATRAFSEREVQESEEFLQEEIRRFQLRVENVSKLQDLFSSLTPLNDDLSSWFPVLKIIEKDDQGVYRDRGVGEGGFFPEDRSKPTDTKQGFASIPGHTEIKSKTNQINQTKQTKTKQTKPQQILDTYPIYDAKSKDNSLIETANVLSEYSAGVDTRMQGVVGVSKALENHTALSSSLKVLSGLPEAPVLDMSPLERVQSLCGALEHFRGLGIALSP